MVNVDERKAHHRARSTGLGVLLSGLLLWSCSSSRPPVAGAAAQKTDQAQAGPAPAQTPAPVDGEPSGKETDRGDLSDLSDLSDQATGDPADAELTQPQEHLEAALEAYQSAGDFWDEGDLENALAALEQAFGLLLGVPEGGEALVEQQREDLRRLIAHRIVDIYASRQTAAGEIERSIPILEGEEIEKEIRSFQTGERDFFLSSYRRSGLYRPMILEKIREAGLPEQLSWLPLIESGFKTRARSRAAAVGLWQFIASTGYRFSLSRDRWIDERMDPEKSTAAAIAYLTELHGLFGDWATALAAYNCGEGRVSRLIRNQRFDYLDHFWDLYQQLPRETRRYVPRFFASLLIIENPGRYGIELPQPAAPRAVNTLQIDRGLGLSDIDRRLGLSSGTTASLNPELRHDVTPPGPYTLRVPAGPNREQETVASLVRDIKTPRQAAKPRSESYRVHRVRRGESLARIAAKYRTSVGQLQRVNGIRNRNRIYPGQRIRIPSTTAPRSEDPSPQRITEHRVRRGETLSEIAGRYGTTVAGLQRLNRLSNRNKIYPGQTLKISSGGTIVHIVRRGDTLWDLARRYGSRVSSIMRENGLDRRSARRLRTGQRLRIPRSD